MAASAELTWIEIGALRDVAEQMDAAGRFALTTAVVDVVVRQPGWQVAVMPDGTRVLSNAQWSFNIDTRIDAAAKHAADDWHGACVAAGIAELTVPIYMPHQRSRLRRGVNAVGLGLAVVVALAVITIAGVEEERQSVKGRTIHRETLSPTEAAAQPKVDGRSHLPGNGVVLRYSPRYDDYASESDGDFEEGYHNRASWELSWPFGDGGFASAKVEQRNAYENLDLPEERRGWIGDRLWRAKMDGRNPVEPREVKIGSQTGYVWEDTRGLWKYTIAVPVVDRWYQLECSTMRKNATRAVKKRCLAILRSVRFRRSD